MVGTLSVQKIQGLASSASPTTIEIASGHTLTGGGLGKILQVKNAFDTSEATFTTENTWADITGMSISITPSAATSKILLMATINYSGANNLYAYGRFLRDSTAIGIGTTASSSRINAGFCMEQDNTSPGSQTYKIRTVCPQYVDSPSTTSAITYKVQCIVNDNNSLMINRTHTDADADYGGRFGSHFCVMEVAA